MSSISSIERRVIDYSNNVCVFQVFFNFLTPMLIFHRKTMKNELRNGTLPGFIFAILRPTCFNILLTHVIILRLKPFNIFIKGICIYFSLNYLLKQ